MKEKISYIKFISLLDEILPQTTELDYTKIPPKDLIDKIKNFINTYYPNNNQSKLNKVLDDIEYNILNNLYNKKTHVFMNATRDNPEDYGFDQNNYYIKEQVLTMKRAIIRYIYGPDELLLCWRKSTPPDYEEQKSYLAYDEKFGSVEEIREFIKRENIEKYITSTLTITKESEDGTPGIMDTYRVAGDILNHFGLVGGGSYSDEFKKVKKEIENILYEAMYKSTTYKWDYKYKGQISSAHIDMNQVQLLLKEQINKITDIIENHTQKALKETIEFNKMIQDYRESKKKSRTIEAVNPNSIDINNNEEQIVQQEQNIQVEQKPAQILAESSTENKTIDTKFDNAMAKYKKMGELINENNKLSEKISALEEELKALQEQKKAIEEELVSVANHGL